MSEIVYIVTEIEWQYNDETYYTSDDASGKPLVVYRDMIKAEVAMSQKNIEIAKKWFSGSSYHSSPGVFGYSLEEITDYEDDELKEKFKELGLEWDGKESWNLPTPEADYQLIGFY